jgi:DNA-directed RNA polymerase subunit RPC12/RpoP
LTTGEQLETKLIRQTNVKAQMKIKCPSCDSEDTIRCSVAYQTGTTTGSFGGIGVDLQGDIGGFGGISSSQTLFAQSVSPPKAPASNPFALILLIVGGLSTLLGFAYYNDPDTHKKWICVLMVCIGILLLIIGIYILFVDHPRKMNFYNFTLIQWERQWVCLRCGTKFETRKPIEFIDL